MPAQLEEIAAWSLEEIEAEIERRLPSGWRYQAIWNEAGYWDTSLESPTDPDWQVEWSAQGVDRKLLAFTTYARLSFQDAPTEGRWIRRQEITKEAVAQKAMAPDPEDLDPEEIAHLVHKTRK